VHYAWYKHTCTYTYKHIPYDDEQSLTSRAQLLARKSSHATSSKIFIDTYMCTNTHAHNAQRYDLKGSIVGRETKPCRSSSSSSSNMVSTVVFKDSDLISSETKFQIGSLRKQVLQEQVSPFVNICLCILCVSKVHAHVYVCVRAPSDKRVRMNRSRICVHTFIHKYRAHDFLKKWI
jgi:hypothetical protein